MLHKPFPSGGRLQRRKRSNLVLTAALVAISMSPLAYFADFQSRDDASPAALPTGVASEMPAPEAPKVASTLDPALISPTPILRPEALAFAQNAPLATAFTSSAPRREMRAEPPIPAVASEPVQISAAEVIETVQPAPIPLPVPRPPEFRNMKPSPAPQVGRAPAAAPAAPRTVALASAPVDNRSFIEKLFGIRPTTRPEATLSYAALENGTGSIAPSTRISPIPDGAGAGTAVYDIMAQTVTLPNGETLEAHSGLGDMMDNPRYVNVRMKGATPPGTYIITEREALFHGVRALRLTPVGGSAAIYGRDGILAHTYLLGPRGDSNGCVSFKNYDRFLQAYLRGEVKRLIVTAGRGQDLLPRMAGNPTRQARRSARAI